MEHKLAWTINDVGMSRTSWETQTRRRGRMIWTSRISKKKTAQQKRVNSTSRWVHINIINTRRYCKQEKCLSISIQTEKSTLTEVDTAKLFERQRNSEPETCRHDDDAWESENERRYRVVSKIKHDEEKKCVTCIVHAAGKKFDFLRGNYFSYVSCKLWVSSFCRTQRQ